MRLIAVGEILWDLFGDRECLGGAVLNMAAQAARLGHDVALVSAVGEDERGRRALARARELGLATRFVPSLPSCDTGTVTVTVDHGGQPTYVIHRPAAYDFARLSEDDFTSLSSPPPDCISYGTLMSICPGARRLIAAIIERFPGARRFYDVNLRKDSYTPALVRDLLASATLVKLNDHEAAAIQEMCGHPATSLETFCRSFTERFGWEGVCVTRGEHGCALLLNGTYAELPAYCVRVADTVGAGDAFAAGFLHGVASNWPVREIGDFANRLGALVASRPGGTPEWSLAELDTMRTTC